MGRSGAGVGRWSDILLQSLFACRLCRYADSALANLAYHDEMGMNDGVTSPASPIYNR